MTPRGLALRVGLVGALVLGLVGMHHVVIACHHATPADSVVAVADHHGPGAPASQGDHEEDSAVGAAAVCLAILLGVLSLFLPLMRRRARRGALARAVQRGSPHVARLLDPPDLNVLSIART